MTVQKKRRKRKGWGTSGRALAAIGATLVLVLSACGGGDEPSVGDILGAVQGVEINDDGGVSTTFGEASVTFGSGERPTWLEDWVELPEGSEIGMAIDDPSTGDRAIEALVRGTSAEVVEDHFFSLLLAQGYERLGETGFFVKPGVPIIDVSVSGDGEGLVRYSWEHETSNSEQALRDVYAPAESAGTLTLTVGGVSTEMAGTCTLRSTSGSFATDDGGSSFNVEVREEGNHFVEGVANLSEGDELAIWSFNFEQAPEVVVTADGFMIDGLLSNILGQDPSVSGNVTATCGS